LHTPVAILPPVRVRTVCSRCAAEGLVLSRYTGGGLIPDVLPNALLTPNDSICPLANRDICTYYHYCPDAESVLSRNTASHHKLS